MKENKLLNYLVFMILLLLYTSCDAYSNYVECIRSHIIRWAHEKNRRLTDGYDYEVIFELYIVHKICHNFYIGINRVSREGRAVGKNPRLRNVSVPKSPLHNRHRTRKCWGREALGPKIWG